MYVVLIVNAIGEIREWTRGSFLKCRLAAESLPMHGWRLRNVAFFNEDEAVWQTVSID